MQVFVHGLGQTSSSWKKTIAALDMITCNSCPDLTTMVCGSNITYENLYASFSNECNHCNGLLDLCGLSLGGVLALNYTLDYPGKVNSLVLIAAQYKMPKLLLFLQNAIFRIMPEKAFGQIGFSKRDFISLCKTMAKLDFSAALCKISCPTLIICGENDTTNKKASEKMAKAIKNAKLVFISKAGHEINVEAPEELAETLKDFYRTCRTSALTDEN